MTKFIFLGVEITFNEVTNESNIDSFFESDAAANIPLARNMIADFLLAYCKEKENETMRRLNTTDRRTHYLYKPETEMLAKFARALSMRGYKCTIEDIKEIKKRIFSIDENDFFIESYRNFKESNPYVMPDIFPMLSAQSPAELNAKFHDRQLDSQAIRVFIEDCNIARDLYRVSHVFDYPSDFSGWHNKATRYMGQEFCQQAEVIMQGAEAHALNISFKELQPNFLPCLEEHKQKFEDIVIQGKPLPFNTSVACDGGNHAIGTLIWGDIVVVSNAGESSRGIKGCGMYFYRVRPEGLAGSLIEYLKPWGHPKLKEFEALVDNNAVLEPLAFLPVEPQESGNCTWSGTEMNLQAYAILANLKAKVSTINSENIKACAQRIEKIFIKLLNAFKLNILHAAVMREATFAHIQHNPKVLTLIRRCHYEVYNSDLPIDAAVTCQLRELKQRLTRTSIEYMKLLLKDISLGGAVGAACGAVGAGVPYTAGVQAKNMFFSRQAKGQTEPQNAGAWYEPIIVSAAVGGAIGAVAGVRKWFKRP